MTGRIHGQRSSMGCRVVQGFGGLHPFHVLEDLLRAFRSSITPFLPHEDQRTHVFPPYPCAGASPTNPDGVFLGGVTTERPRRDRRRRVHHSADGHGLLVPLCTRRRSCSGDGQWSRPKSEGNPVQQTLTEHGLTATTLHKQFLREEPRVTGMHIGGTGRGKELAECVRRFFRAWLRCAAATGRMPRPIPARTRSTPTRLPRRSARRTG